MAKKKTGPKKPKAPKTIEPPVYVGIEPPPLIIDRRPPVKPPTTKPLTKAYDCMFSTKQLTFYLLEIEGPTSSKNAGPFVFNYAPRNVSWKKPVTITEYKTQGNISQPIYFSSAGNKKLVLNDIIFNGDNHLLPHDQLNRLQLLQLPAKGTTKLRVFQLLVGNLEGKKFAARSYGKYVISSLDIVEQFRDPNSGLTLRAKVNLELLEVAQYQVDLGNDLAVPTTIVPTLPKELLAETAAPPAPPELGQETVSGEAIPANSLIAKVGKETASVPNMAPHLHFVYRNKNETDTQAAARYLKQGIKDGNQFTYPKQILDLITLGPWQYKDQKSEAKKLSELKVFSGLGPRRSGYHKGVDYQLPGFGGPAMEGCPIYMNVPCSWAGRGQNPDGCYAWEISEPGLDGVVIICHIRELGEVSGTHNKKASSIKPLNKGGTTDKAIKKKDELTGDR